MHLWVFLSRPTSFLINLWFNWYFFVVREQLEVSAVLWHRCLAELQRAAEKDFFLIQPVCTSCHPFL